MNKRLIIALVLSIVVLVIYEAWIGKEIRKAPPPQKQQQQEEKVVEKRSEERRETPATGWDEQARVPGKAGAPKAATAYEDVVVETPLYRAVFTTYGGRLKSWGLKGYKDRAPMHPLGKWVQNLVNKVLGKEAVSEEPPEPVDIVRSEGLEHLPLALKVDVEGVTFDEGIPAQASASRVVVRDAGGREELAFSWRGPDGSMVERIYGFYGNSYRLDVRVKIKSGQSGRGGTVGMSWESATGGKTGYYGFFGPVYYGPSGLEEVKTKHLKNEDKVVKDFEWFGFDEEYFIFLMYPESEARKLVMASSGNDRISSTVLTPLGEKEGAGAAYRAYLGPKEASLLAEVGESAKKALDYGWFSLLAIPILKLLNFTHSFTGNYGVDIILLAIILKILFTPLTHKSQKSMKEMQKVQPEIKRLQEKYKGDRQRLNQEVMELYKRRKVNPFSGCLPMLIQLPVFFALYRGLMNSIELRHSPFMLWITDLSDKDPTYISPLLMGASMVIQQKMSTMPTADPTQSKLMTLMPIFFTFIFLNFPSGLVLYWLVTNVLTIGHQMYVNRKK